MTEKKKSEEESKGKYPGFVKKIVDVVGVGLFSEAIDSLKNRIKDDVREVIDVAILKIAIGLISMIGAILILYGLLKMMTSLLPTLPQGANFVIIGASLVVIAYIIRLSEKDK